MTVENRDGNFFVGLSNIMHETGHLLYMLSLNRLDPRIRDTPLGQFNGLGLHETAAMYFEQASATEKFWELAAPMIREHFDVDGPAWTADNLRRLMNDPKPEDTSWGASELALLPNMYFRVMAERHILDGRMEVDELPAFWARTMTDLTGRTHDAADFFVDESHWFDRYSGYFPAYWIGSLCGARLHDMAAADAATAQDLTGYFRACYNVIEEKIMRHASQDRPMDLVARELGGAPQDFLRSQVARMMENYLGPAGAAEAGRILGASARRRPAPDSGPS